MKRIAILALVVAAAAAGAFAWVRYAPRHVPSGQPALQTLDPGSLPAFRDAFNASEGQIRILAMLSPT